jgi:hypothetical protein
MVVLLIALGGQGAEGAAIAYTATAGASFVAAVVSVHVVMRRAEAAAKGPPVAPQSVELTH